MMLNEYKRKPSGSNRATWSEEDLEKAIPLVKDKSLKYEILGDICVVCGEYYHATKKKCDWLQYVQCEM
ncbi:hypothetical protein HW555_004403 [Spodoptera exigua]|uniref:Uncharacterized protein n=1 Tax=Spodoptera exigua TaxID=7107 RepID=A0A835L8D7_SPOEX|nr:hypothetical protein HW555_004403 [Spodoptera exigua]